MLSQANKYLENYDRALRGFEAASLKDPGLKAGEEVQKIIHLLEKLESTVKVIQRWIFNWCYPGTLSITRWNLVYHLVDQKDHRCYVKCSYIVNFASRLHTNIYLCYGHNIHCYKHTDSCTLFFSYLCF